MTVKNKRTNKSSSAVKQRSKRRTRLTTHAPKSITPDHEPRTESGAGSPFLIVGIGASAGGLEAYTQLLSHLPPDTGMGFVLVQHLDPEHENALAQILGRVTSLPVHTITDHQRVEPNHVYVIPRDTSLRIAQGVLKLEPRQKARVPHRPIDAFFESLAQDQHNRAIGVVLSGTASDGTMGLEAIKAGGGITFAQDNSAKYESMPRSAVAAGCVDMALSPAGIAQELTRISKHPYVAGRPFEVPFAMDDDRESENRAESVAHAADDTPPPSGDGGSRHKKGATQSGARTRRETGPDGSLQDYKKILMLLHNHSGVDFTLYKSTTIQRRISRRLVLARQNTLADYADFLRGNTAELSALYSDVLISVTSFFRNPEMFDVLQREILPELLKQHGDDPLRCWVLGCSTGQEAYSIAISFVEAAEKAPRMRKLQIFATDLNEALLEKARLGLYARSLDQDISPERLRRFFVEEEGGYRVSKALREMVVFARQNLIADPPFSRLDLISCRNLLIYLEQSLQKRAMPTFHYALKPGGFLLLGSSESIGVFTDLFEPVDKKNKIFSRKATSTSALHLPVPRSRRGEAAPPGLPLLQQQSQQPDAAEALRSEQNALREADRVIVNQFGPPGVLINAELQVLQFRGSTSEYLQPPSGKASFDVLKMAREGLMLPLRTVINQSKKANKVARKENVRFNRNGKTRTVNLEVIPLKNLRESCLLVLFEEPQKTGHTGKRAPAIPPVSKKQERSRIAELETDLAETREYLQSVQEQHETAIEELQAANEEVQSANEELQSVNEELETSKEELESSNEELITVNEEMSARNIELNRLNDDLMNLQTSSKLAVVLLGRDLTIRRFSSQAQKQFDLIAADVGRPVGHIRHGFMSAPPLLESGQAEGGSRDTPVDLEGILADVITSVHEQEYEVRDQSGHWYSMRVCPYMTLDNKVDGAVLLLVDIDALKRSGQAIAEARDYAENIIATVREPLLVLDETLRIESANSAFYRTFYVTPDETRGQFIYDLCKGQWNIPRLRELLEEILQQNTTIENFRVETLDSRIMLLNARRIADIRSKNERVLLAIEDITERSRAEETLRENHAQLLAHTDELTRFNDAAVGRELRMIELKKEVNELSRRLGLSVPYPLEFEREANNTDDRTTPEAGARPGQAEKEGRDEVAGS